MDLFDYSCKQEVEKNAPLARRMCPRSLQEFFGQRQIVGKGRLLRRLIKLDRLSSLIFYGPPGTGKTALAQVIANTTSARFEKLNAVTSGVSDLREVIAGAKRRLGEKGKKTILFIDEIHRFNKAQQDALLPSVEEGIITLIGATTENPFFEVNPPLVSRSRIFEFEPLDRGEIAEILRRALADSDRGLGDHEVEFEEGAFDHIVESAGGDARMALTALELAVLTTDPDEDGIICIDLRVAEEATQKRAIVYDRQGDNHYDTISAFIKSMRGSDPDAAIYWLAKMIAAGEDPRFIARRLVIHAAEDVGCADPHALVVATSAARAVDQVGMPEARIPLAQAAIYIATAPKSNACVMAIDRALEDIKSEGAKPVPSHLQDSHYGGAGELGRGEDYLYPHDYKHNIVKQQYLPEGMEKNYYRPEDTGFERKLKNRLAKWREFLAQSESGKR